MAKPAPAPSTGTGALAVMPAAGPAATVDLAAWRRVLARIAGANPGLASIYEHAVPVEVSAARLHVGYDETSFLGGQASDAENLEVLRREARAELGPAVVVSVDLALGDGERHRTVASMDAEVRRKELAEARRAVETHPLVAEAVALFGAEIRDVKLPPREGGG